MNPRGQQACLLLLPALLLLLAFTHAPAVATLFDSFFSTAKAGRPSVWVGLDNYQVMVNDPTFRQAARNNLWFALATICRPRVRSTSSATGGNCEKPWRTRWPCCSSNRLMR